MKKFWEQVKEKAILGLIMSMLGIGGTFLWNTGRDLWNLPKTVKELKALHTQDSTMAVKYIIKLDSLAREVTETRKFQDEDFKTIQRIKYKLKLK